MAPAVDTWPVGAAPALAELARLTLPSERLSADELLGVCWEQDGPGRAAVLGLVDGSGAAALAVRPAAPAHRAPVGVVTFLAVEPAAQGEGRGRRLLEAAHEWAFEEAGASTVVAGGLTPFYLWPGALLSALCGDLQVAGHADAEIAWVGPIGFYVRTAGASVSRTFLTFARVRA